MFNEHSKREHANGLIVFIQDELHHTWHHCQYQHPKGINRSLCFPTMYSPAGTALAQIFQQTSQVMEISSKQMTPNDYQNQHEILQTFFPLYLDMISPALWWLYVCSHSVFFYFQNYVFKNNENRILEHQAHIWHHIINNMYYLRWIYWLCSLIQIQVSALIPIQPHLAILDWQNYHFPKNFIEWK